MGSHQKENINAHGTVPFLDKIEMSVAECQKVGKNIFLCSHCRKH